MRNKIILVTGGCGSIGSAIVKHALKKSPKQIRILDNRESSQNDLEKEINDDRIRYLQGDIRDYSRLKLACDNVNIVFHCAALKHVHLCERNPREALYTNIIGTENLIEAAQAMNVEKVVNISTDKAVNPVSMLGISKAAAEKLIIEADQYKDNTIFCNVRFGNVLGSRGSIIEEIAKDVIKVTDPNMTRFIMTIKQAVELVFLAAEIMKGGETYVLKMPAFRLQTLVDVMKKPGQNIAIVGPRDGERPYEVLVSLDEMPRCFETDNFWIITKNSQKNDAAYVPNSAGTKLLTEHELIDMICQTRDHTLSLKQA